MRKRIVFRADGNGVIGFGHVYRLLALADMLKDTFECVFVIDRPAEILRERITQVCTIVVLNTGYRFLPPDQTGIDNEAGFDLEGIVTAEDIVVLDGYHFQEAYQRGLKARGCKQVCVDDLLQSYPLADVIINHAPGIDPSVYRTNAVRCLGLSFALLRKPFFLPFTKSGSGRALYISMGGSDKDGQTIKVCSAAIRRNVYDNIHVLCSDQFDVKHLEALEAMRQRYPVSLHFNLSAGDIVALLARCSEAFVASSTVMIEAYARGLYCYTGYTANNQRHLYDGFVRERYAAGLGELRTLSEGDIIEKMSQHPPLQLLEQPLKAVTAYHQIFQQLADA